MAMVGNMKWGCGLNDHALHRAIINAKFMDLVRCTFEDHRESQMCNNKRLAVEPSRIDMQIHRETKNKDSIGLIEIRTEVH
eukprot:m.469497 g.469497  ORF g.469497 m.469497 type:complete len:81 (-) comp28598_c0_seq1:24-266(-)